MSCLLQLSAVIVTVYWLESVNGTPLFQGFSVQKGFEVNLKPFEFKPLSFFKEKWSPFGSFGYRKGIQKRDLEGVSGSSENRERLPPVVPPAPVFENVGEENHMDEAKDNMEATRLLSGPDPVKPFLSNMIRVPLTESFRPPTEGLYTSIGRNPSANNYILEKPAPSLPQEMYGELPPRPVGPVPATTANFIPAQPISPFYAQPGFMPAESVSPISEQPIRFISAQPVGVTPVQPQDPQAVIPLITPPRPTFNVPASVPLSEIPPTDGPLVRGSKVALYFGNVFLQLVSQFLTNARLQFSRFYRQPPPPSVPISN